MIFVDEPDPGVTPLGVKGLGEIGFVGVAAAVANAFYHATGKRVRSLPITVDKLLAALSEPVRLDSKSVLRQLPGSLIRRALRRRWGKCGRGAYLLASPLLPKRQLRRLGLACEDLTENISPTPSHAHRR